MPTGPKGKPTTGKGIAASGKRGPRYVKRQKAKNLARKKQARRKKRKQNLQRAESRYQNRLKRARANTRRRNELADAAGGYSQPVLGWRAHQGLDTRAAENVAGVYDPLEAAMRAQSRNDLSGAQRGVTDTSMQAINALQGISSASSERDQAALAQQAAFGDALGGALGGQLGEGDAGLMQALAQAGQNLAGADQAQLASQGLGESLAGVNVADLNEQVAAQRAEGNFAEALPGIAALQAGQTNQALALQSQSDLSQAMLDLQVDRGAATFDERNRLEDVARRSEIDQFNQDLARDQFGFQQEQESTRQRERGEDIQRSALAERAEQKKGESDRAFEKRQNRLDRIAAKRKEGREAKRDKQQWKRETRRRAREAGAERAWEKEKAALQNAYDRAQGGQSITPSQKKSVVSFSRDVAGGIAKQAFESGSTANAITGEVTGNTADAQAVMGDVFDAIKSNMSDFGVRMSDTQIRRMAIEEMKSVGFDTSGLSANNSGFAPITESGGPPR